MELNMSRPPASEVYLLHRWNGQDGSLDERRTKIFREFLQMGTRGRWQWHAEAEKTEYGQFTAEERTILSECRDGSMSNIAGWIGENMYRAMVAEGTLDMSEEELRLRTGNADLVCSFDGDVLDVLPELAYSMTAFDDPADVEEARRDSRDQSLFVTGVFWRGNKIQWLDECGNTVREKVVTDERELTEGAEAFEEFRPFESIWWTDATKIGKYAEDGWWM